MKNGANSPRGRVDTAKTDPREAAYRLLLGCEKENRYVSLALGAFLDGSALPQGDRAFVSALVYGVTERKLTLDYFIKCFSGKPLSSLDREVRMLLRLGMYQIIYLDRVPDSAAVNETVTLASKVASRSKGFVNAVLRRTCREKAVLPYPDEKKDRLGYLSVFHSVPYEICALWKKDYPEDFEGLISSANSQPPVTLSVNTLKTDADGLIGILKDLGADAEKCLFSPRGVRLSGKTSIPSLAPLSEGLCYVQDEASQTAGIALGARPGDTVIDVCACPGGKSFFAAISMENRGKVYCFDLHESKLSLIKSEAEKLGISILDISAHDSRSARADLIGKADRVICDVPCSGLGVIAKKPEIRHKKPDADGIPLEELQYEILENSSAYLKVGGILVYSTCTLRRSENEGVTDRFAASHPDFAYVGISEAIPDGKLTLMPHKNLTDGFFIAKLQRIK